MALVSKTRQQPCPGFEESVELHQTGRLWWPFQHHLVPLPAEDTYNITISQILPNIWGHSLIEKVYSSTSESSMLAAASSISFPSSSMASLILASRCFDNSSEVSTSSALGTLLFVLARMSIWRCSLNWIWKRPSCWASHRPWRVFPDPRVPISKTRGAGGFDKSEQNIFEKTLFYGLQLFYFTLSNSVLVVNCRGSWRKASLASVLKK